MMSAPCLLLVSLHGFNNLVCEVSQKGGRYLICGLVTYFKNTWVLASDRLRTKAGLSFS